MTGFVKVGGVWCPESSAPPAPFHCHLCGAELRERDYERHIADHLRREEAETKDLSIQQRIPEFFAVDTEREQYLRSPAGIAEWRRKVDPTI